MTDLMSLQWKKYLQNRPSGLQMSTHRETALLQLSPASLGSWNEPFPYQNPSHI
jgi:hypothetical protein